MSNTITPDVLLAQMRALAAQAQGASALQTPSDKTSGFAELLKQSIQKVNATQQQATDLQMAFEKGETEIQLSQIMVAMQKANISFQAMLEVRNKLVNAYEEIMNMQI